MDSGRAERSRQPWRVQSANSSVSQESGARYIRESHPNSAVLQHERGMLRTTSNAAAHDFAVMTWCCKVPSAVVVLWNSSSFGCDRKSASVAQLAHSYTPLLNTKC